METGENRQQTFDFGSNYANESEDLLRLASEHRAALRSSLQGIHTVIAAILWPEEFAESVRGVQRVSQQIGEGASCNLHPSLDVMALLGPNPQPMVEFIAVLCGKSQNLRMQMFDAIVEIMREDSMQRIKQRPGPLKAGGNRREVKTARKRA